MNFYNPYTNFYPFASMPAARTGLLSGLFRNGINWGTILSNSQRTLGLINQAIPVVKQISPVVKNAKTMFKVMSECKKVDTPVSTPNKDVSVENKTTPSNNNSEKTSSTTTNEIINETPSNGPTFFV